MPGVRYLPQDRLQDLRPVQGSRPRGLTDRSRRPYCHGCRLPFQIEQLLLQVKREYPSWGAPKIREKTHRKHSEIQLPAISTVHAVIERHGLVNRRRRYKAQGTPLFRPLQPNELWCAVYKGEFMLADRRYCYPLIITDAASRYLIGCGALANTQATFAFRVFERVFREFGLPQAIRTDNGTSFASPNSLFGLSQLSVWWLRLGIGIERMHLTLKKEATKPAARNLLQQKERFDRFLDEFNHERPHQALDMQCPAERYVSSPRHYKGLSDLGSTPSTIAPSP